MHAHHPSHPLRARASNWPLSIMAALLLPAFAHAAEVISINAQFSVKAISAGQYKLRNACNGKLVDVESAPSPWSRVEQRSDGQGWEVSEQGDGTYRLLVPGSNSALQTS
jgi:Ricin-type beta-trefoil lectin domain-like